MTNKQKRILEVYGDYVGAIDENGWTNYAAIAHFGIDNLDIETPKKQMIKYRPKALAGIEETITPEL